MVALPGNEGVRHIAVSINSEVANQASADALAKEKSAKLSKFSLRMAENPLVSPNGGQKVYLSIPSGAGAEDALTTVGIYDLRGRKISEVFSGYLVPGDHLLPWRPKVPLSSGVYFVRASMGRETKISKFLILK